MHVESTSFVQVDTAKLLRKGYRAITLESFAELVQMLTHMIKGATSVPEPTRGYNSEHLRGFLVENKIFLPEKYGGMFSLDEPEYVITYLWLGTTLRELLGILREHFDGRNATFWLDILFNDQMVRPLCFNAALEAWKPSYSIFCSIQSFRKRDSLCESKIFQLSEAKVTVSPSVAAPSRPDC
jgi:hypothetical protein